MQFQPLIRYVGGKRKQSEEIISMMPMKIGTCYIPFLGSGAIMFQLVNSNIEFDRIVVSDKYKPLMGIFDLIKNDPNKLLGEYTKYYDRTVEKGEEAYNEIRDEFNSLSEEEQDPSMFFYLTRAAIRGNLDYDNNGNFVTKCQKLNALDRNCISSPDSLSPIMMRWNNAVQNVEFRCEDYWDTIKDAQEGDFVFFDPPYIDGTWYRHHDMDYDKLWDDIRKLPCDWSMTLNGDKDTYSIPDDLYTDVEYIYYGVKTSKSGRPIGSRDTYWMKRTTDKYQYDETRKRNVRQNERGNGGRIPQVNDITMFNELHGRIDKVEDAVGDINNKIDTLLNMLMQKGE